MCLAISNTTIVVKTQVRFSNMTFILFMESFKKALQNYPFNAWLLSLFRRDLFLSVKVFGNIFQIACRLSLDSLDMFASIIVLVYTNSRQKASAVSAKSSLNSEDEY